jgi:MraZ protein
VYFFGTFEHSIDERGRLAIPARYRRAFVDGGVLRDGPEGCIELYTESAFNEEIQRRLGSEAGNRRLSGRRIRRSFMHNAFSVELDRQGRVLIPQQLRDADDSESRMVIVGCGDYLELWSPEAWSDELERVRVDGEAEETDTDL